MKSSLQSVLRRVTTNLIRKAAARKACPQLEVLESRDNPTGTYAGVVFQDFDSDGVRDTTETIANTGTGTVGAAIDGGLGNVTVTAFNAAGPAGSTTTLATGTPAQIGTFSFTPTGAGPYRFEFTTLPTGFQSGPRGTNSGTTVQFHPDGGAANVSTGAVLPEAFVQTDPLIINTVMNFGDPATENPTATALYAVPYSAGAATGNPAQALAIDVPVSRLGAVNGVAYDPFARNVYTSAYFKRHSGLGEGGTGGIYRFNYPAGAPTGYNPPAGSLLYVDLNAVFGAGTAGVNAHDTIDNNGNGLFDDYNTDSGNAGWDAVGKSGLGAMDTSADGQFIFVTNLADRQVYRVPTSGPLNTTTIQRVQIPLGNPRPDVITAGRFHSEDLRPFAVRYYNGKVYVGVTYTAETEATGFGDQTARDELVAAVYELDPATMAFVGTPLFTTRLNYVRSQSSIGFAQPNLPSTWEPWVPTYDSTASFAGQGVAPQPMFSDIAFDPSGNMTLAFRDRGADQIGYFSFSDPANPTQPIEGFTAGDMLQAFINVPNNLGGGWTLESNARGPAGQGAGPQGNNAGPGGGEFFYQEFYSTSHGETSMGAVLQVPGRPDVVSTQMDPLSNVVRAGGLSWTGNTTGTEVKAYQKYANVNGNNPGLTFGKANGLGALALIHDLPPVEIGNRVWIDANNNGVQDPGVDEAGVSGVTVRLYTAAGVLVPGATTTTDGAGNYYFSSTTLAGLLPNTAYSIRMDNPADYLVGGPLAGRRPTTALNDPTPNGTARDSNATLPTPAAPIGVGNFPTISLTTGGPGANNHTYDAGFNAATLSLGNQVFIDANNDGSNVGETGINGVVVNLYFDADGSGALNGAETTAVATTTTATVGVTAGLYLFTGLAAGNYIVELAASNFTGAGVLAGYVSSTGTIGSANGPFEGGALPDPDNNTDNVDDGNTTGPLGGGGVIRSGFITLAAGTEPLLELPTNDPGTDADGNLTLDFGVFRPMSIGSLVWDDRNNDGDRDGGEPGLNGLTVQLRNAANTATIATTTTDTNGNYIFSYLIPGDYVVRVALPTGFASSSGTNASATGAFEPAPDPDNNTDNVDDGSTNAGFATSLPVTLVLGNEPTGETASPLITDPAADNNSNFSVDIGMYAPLSLGNQVFNDATNDGSNAGDAGINGVLVELLYDADGNGTISGAELTPIATATTATVAGTAGLYLFTNLLPGNYSVQLAASNFTAGGVLAGFASSTGGSSEPAADPDNDTDNVDDGTTVGTLGGTGVIRSAPITLAVGGEPGTESPNNDPAGAIAVNTNLTLDFGVFASYSLGNRVWRDVNNSGTIDAADGLTPGLAGLTVNLYRDANNDGTPDAGPPAATATTDANGYYRFDGLSAGNYIVEVLTAALPTGLVSSTVDGGDPDNDTDNDDNGVVLGGGFVRSNPVTLGPGATEPTSETDTAGPGDPGAANNLSNLSVDFGFTDAYYRLSGNIYHDADNDGVIDGGEPLITQLTTITLTGTDYLGNPVNISQTTSTGMFDFTGLRPSNGTGYTLTQTLQPTGYLDGRETPGEPFGGTAPAVGETITGIVIPVGAPADNEANAGINYNFGEILPASLGDFVWLDVNANGIQDGGTEVGIQGVSVTLTGTSDRGAVGPTTIQTGVGGAYLFDQLRPGTYTVTFGNSTATTTYARTVQNGAGSTPANDSNADQGTGVAPAVTLVAGQNDPTIDAGLIGLASVGDLVWYDADNSGTQNGTEPGLGLVTVLLDYAGRDGVFGTGDDQIGLATQQTTAAGGYLFTDLQPGKYRVRVDASTLPNGITAQTYDLDGLATANVAEFTLAAAENRRDVDFGYRGTASLGDTVWYDLDKSGTQNNNEPGIANASVGLTWAGPNGTFGDADDFSYPAQLTTAAGKYLFGNLPAGNFRATVDTTTVPAGVPVNTYDLDNGTTTPNSKADTTLTTGQNRTDVDFGYTGTGALGDRVWLDGNGDGVQDAGEPGIPGVTATLTWYGPDGLPGGGDDVVQTTTTGANGIYGFGSLPPGNFLVALSGVPAGLVQTGDPDAAFDSKSSPTLAAGETNLLQDFGYKGNGLIAGNVYVDLDDDGVFDPTETPIAGVTVTLTGSNNQGGQVNQTTTTAADGSYSFVNLLPGTYTVTETQPAKYGDGKETVGSLGGTVGPDVFSEIVLGSGQIGTPYNFGERPGTISGVVFYDADKDGVLDPGETPIAGVTVTLRDAAGNVVGTTTTAADGSYSFTNLPAGDYTVTETQPGGYGNPLSGPFAPDARPVTLPPGGNVPDQNFGDTLGSIAGSVYADLNNNGVRDAGEPGIGGVTVTLTGPTPGTTTTAADGSFLFPNLAAGTYQLVETQPPIYNDGLEAVGTSGGVIVLPDTISTIGLGAGVDAVNYTFGELSASVTGVSYHDVNGDGVFTPGTDTPLPNVTVTLTGPNGVTLTTVTGPDGTYSFTGLAGGTYTLTETQPAGFGNSETPTNVRSVTVPANGTVGNQNFGNTLGSIAGTVYVDFNLSGAYNPAGPDTPLAGITVTLRDAAGNVVATQQTDASGNYLFTSLPLGTYTVVETQPPAPSATGGYYDGADNLGSLGGTQPVKNTLSAVIGLDPATGGAQNGVQYNFGELPPADPFGFVYHDVNRNGLMDAGEPGIPGVTITITGTAFAGSQFEQPFTTQTTTTNAAGRWEFNPIPPGVYTITETQPAGFQDGQDRNGETVVGGAVTVGNDVFSNIAVSPLPIRGPFLFGEVRNLTAPPALPPVDFFPPVVVNTDVSKRQFLSSEDTTATNGGTTAPVGPTSPTFTAFSPSAARSPVFVAIGDGGTSGYVRVFDFASGVERFRFKPYGDFTGGVRVAVADVNGDSIPDIVTAPGISGGPVVKAFDGNTGAEIRSILAFEPSFRGGLQVAAADINGDGFADLIVTPDQGGGPIVRAFDGQTGAVLANFFGLDDSNFRGGLRIATGDINNDGRDDLLVTAGIGGGPRVAGYDGATLTTTRAKLFGDFFAFAPELRDGFWVSAGDTDGDGFADLTIGAGVGGAPRVGVYSGQLLTNGGGTTPVTSFFAGDATSRSGARVKAIDVDNDGRAEVLAAGEAGVLPTVYLYNPLTGARRDAFYGFPTNEVSGVYVG